MAALAACIRLVPTTVVLMLGILVLFHLALLYRPFRRVFFAYAYTALYRYYLDERLTPIKERHFATIHKLASKACGQPKSDDSAVQPDGWESKKSSLSTLKLLEIGIGSGGNLKFYPSEVHFIGLDPNPHFRLDKKHTSRFASFTHILGFAEDMHRVPSGSIDVVTSTYTHCSVRSREDTLREVACVLRPGGRYFFFEHVQFSDETHPPWRAAQRAVEPFWTLWTNGCVFRPPTQWLIREMSAELRMDVECETFEQDTILPGLLNWCLLWMVQPHALGVAIKRME